MSLTTRRRYNSPQINGGVTALASSMPGALVVLIAKSLTSPPSIPCCCSTLLRSEDQPLRLGYFLRDMIEPQGQRKGPEATSLRAPWNLSSRGGQPDRLRHLDLDLEAAVDYQLDELRVLVELGVDALDTYGAVS